MMIAIAIVALVWGFGLGLFWERLNRKRPAIHIIQGEVEFIAMVVAGGLVESVLILGAIFL